MGSSAKKRPSLAAALGVECGVSPVEAQAGGWQTIEEIVCDLRGEGAALSRRRVEVHVRAAFQNGTLERTRLYDGTKARYVYRAKEGE